MSSGFTPIIGQFKDLAKRRLTEETCRKFSYRVANTDHGTVQVADYKRDGKVIAQKIRTADKKFSMVGAGKEVGFFGQHLFTRKDRMLVITEGEIDAMSVSQVLGHKHPVVSLPTGASSAKRVFQKEAEFLEQFERVVLMFDQDEPGQAAIEDVASMLRPGQAYIATCPAKDPNDALVQEKHADLVRAVWDASEYRPDGIIDAADLWDEITKVEVYEQHPYPWEGLNKLTHGMRKGELVTITSGSGMGKSSVIRELLYDLLNHGYKVGGMFLEESVKRTAQGLMGIHANVPLHLHGYEVDLDTMREAFDATAGTGRLLLYDHFGSSEIDSLMSKIVYLCQQGCDWIVLDHVSMVVSGIGEGDERRLIDNLMTKLRTIVSRFGVGMLVVSHLKRPEGISHEEGGRTTLGQLRGSAAIAQLSDICIGLERNQQHDEEAERNKTLIRVLKNRYSGQTGPATALSYDIKTGRLSETDFSTSPVPSVSFSKGPAVEEDTSLPF
jgi:twinkle protein